MKLMIWFPAFSSLFLGVAHSIDAKNRLRIERNFSATSSPYEPTAYQVSNGKGDVGRKAVSILKEVGDDTVAVVSIVNKHVSLAAMHRTMKAPFVAIRKHAG